MAEALGDRAVDLLVCNAGVYLDKGHDIDSGYGADLWAQSFATNVTGVFLSIQALLPHLRRAPAGKIAIIASQMASSTQAPGGIYHPGWVRTDMGGDNADIGTDEAVSGLAARFDALGIETTGCFETWDGRA